MQIWKSKIDYLEKENMLPDERKKKIKTLLTLY